MSRSFDMTCLQDLLDPRGRPWSQRVWTLQEFLLAWDVIFMCGDKALHRNDFLRALKYTKDLERSKSFKMIESLPGCFHDWCSLLDLWIGCERPHVWNGLRKRHPPSYIQSVLLRCSPKRGSVFSFKTMKPDGLLNIHLWDCWWSLMLLKLVLVIVIAGRLPLYYYLMGLLPIYGLLHSFGHMSDGTTFSKWPRPSKFAAFFAGYRSKREDEECLTEPLSALNGIMQAARHRDATDSKDKSYAMYGILEMLGVSLSTPDYGKAPGLVYQEFFSDVLAWRGDCLRFLMDVRAEDEQQPEQIPTWVPPFHVTPRWLNPKYYIGENHFSATNATIHVSAPAEGPYLKVKVHWRGQVSSCSGPLDWSGSPQKLHGPVAKFLDWFYRLRLKAPSKPAYASIADAVFSVLEARIKKKGMASYDFNEWYRTMMELVEKHGPSPFDNPEAIQDALDTIQTNESAQRYFEECCKSLTTARRNLFVTQYGYLGSGTDTMREGDGVALILGLPVPMILRNPGEGSRGYSVVGPAFVHGMMEGEDWWEDYSEETYLV